MLVPWARWAPHSSVLPCLAWLGFAQTQVPEHSAGATEWNREPQMFRSDEVTWDLFCVPGLGEETDRQTDKGRAPRRATGIQGAERQQEYSGVKQTRLWSVSRGPQLLLKPLGVPPHPGQSPVLGTQCVTKH